MDNGGNVIMTIFIVLLLCIIGGFVVQIYTALYTWQIYLELQIERLK